MKKLVVLFISVLLFACNIRNTKNSPDGKGPLVNTHFTDTTSVQIIDSAYDFGNVTDGEKVIFNYRFRNTGSKPLVIASATASCGCTVPEKPEEPIQPGETGFLKVVFNSEGRVGPTHKEIMVLSNAYPAFPVLMLTGQVVSKNK